MKPKCALRSVEWSLNPFFYLCAKCPWASFNVPGFATINPLYSKNLIFYCIMNTFLRPWKTPWCNVYILVSFLLIFRYFPVTYSYFNTFLWLIHISILSSHLFIFPYFPLTYSYFNTFLLLIHISILSSPLFIFRYFPLTYSYFDTFL